MNHPIKNNHFTIAKIFIKVITLIILFNDCILFSQNSMEYWSDYELSKLVSENVTLKIKPSFRYNSNLKNHYWSDVAIRMKYKTNCLTQIGIFFRPISIKAADSWSTEYRPYTDIELYSTFRNVNMKDRNRFEFRLKRNDNSFWYRNKLTAGETVLIKNVLGIGFADEVFFDFGSRKLNINRIYLDIKYHILNKTIFGLGFIKQQKLCNDNWSNANIIRSSIIFKI